MSRPAGPIGERWGTLHELADAREISGAQAKRSALRRFDLAPGEASWKLWQWFTCDGLNGGAGPGAEDIQGFVLAVVRCWIARLVFGLVLQLGASVDAELLRMGNCYQSAWFGLIQINAQITTRGKIACVRRWQRAPTPAPAT